MEAKGINLKIHSKTEGEKGEVILSGISKSFRRATKRGYSTIKSRMLGFFSGGAQNYVVRQQVLKNFNVHLKPGAALGLVGRNGSGKSTLLKLIAGIYKPEKGTVIARGRISALIELGAGFHPDFTGRENIYLGGAMYGLTKKEVDLIFDEVVEFAELRAVIDEPVRTYSSGMYMRLGFSLAVHTDPDILLVDEVLAVGDASFIHRCHDKISDLKRRGKTLIFVTHDLTSVLRWCDEAIWLDKGVVQSRGEPRVVIDAYLQQLDAEDESKLKESNLLEENTETENSVVEDDQVDTSEAAPEEEKKRWGNGAVELSQVQMCDQNNEFHWLFYVGDSVKVSVHYNVLQELTELIFGIGIERIDGVSVFGTNTAIDAVEVSSKGEKIKPHSGSYSFTIDKLNLNEGTYYLDVAAHRLDGTPYDYHHRMYTFSVRNKVAHHGLISFNPKWEIHV